MNIVSVTMVKNESDIIESFVKYHANIFDFLIILDNGSSDGTREILTELQKDYSLHVVIDNRPIFAQDDLTTALMKIAREQYQADVIVPIDCDEFLCSETDDIRGLVDHYKSSLIYVPWRTYVPNREDSDELNPILRIENRLESEVREVYKVIVPGGLVEEDFKIKQGNHDVKECNLDGVTKISNLELFYAHYPVRSSNQAISKYVIGWLSNLARRQQVLFDWFPYYKISKRALCSGLSIDNLSLMAANYNAPGEKIDRVLKHDPLCKYKKIEYRLELTDIYAKSPVDNLLNYTEMLAKSHGAMLHGDKAPWQSESAILNSIQPYLGIDGWLSDTEAVNIYREICGIDSESPTIVEIGTWKGKSTYVMAKALKDSGKTGTIYCVDPFNADGDEFSKGIYEKSLAKNTLYDQFIENMRDNEVLDYVSPKVGYSNQVFKMFHEKIDVLFIDGNHEYQQVRDDFLNWSSLLRVGGILMFHDVGSDVNSGPKDVVNEFVSGKPEWSNYSLHDELLITTREC